ncbi:MAG: AbrB/MazE/SpoVT family DNA-binding domain-containing protein [Clostridia bacterium]|nr:AbrB/MazE/SpoVT family DNA-binding domain-containing protein [Clostridia bacterium]
MRVGLHKKIDNLGRVTIPKEYRDFYQLNEKDTVCLIDTKEGLLITNPKFKVVEILETTLEVNDKCYEVKN